jgi:transposase-like protein
MIDSLPRCDHCNSPVTDSIQTEIENHGRVKFGKYVNSSWICSDCMSESIEKNKVSATLTSKDDVHHEHIRAVDKSDVSPNTPPADEADL